MELLKDNFQEITKERRRQVQDFVISGLKQVKEGLVKDFDDVCDRLERKYTDEI